MDRGTRIAIVVSIVWVLLSWWGTGESSMPVNRIENFTILGLFPVVIYWTYRFIRAGRPSKINQPE